MFKEFEQYIQHNQLVSKAQKILLAVSGGIDSMAMMHLFIKGNYNLGVAHGNFQLRGKESDKDQELVKVFCKKNNITFHTINFNTEQYSKQNKVSIQVAARELRYNWFYQLAEEHHYAKIAIAHNKNDIAETLLINLTRGTGLKGLTGIKNNINNIIRPLLFASREEIEVYVKKHQIEYREDQSNTDTKYTRNKIRHKVIPELEKINPQFLDTIQNNIQTFNNYSLFIEAENQKAFDNCAEIKNELIQINIAKFDKYHEVIQYEILSKYGFNADTVKDIQSVFNAQPGKIFNSTSHQLVKDRGFLLIQPITKTHSKEYIINLNNQGIKQPLNLSWKIIDALQYKISTEKHIAALDADLLIGEIKLRKWQHGDYFHPLGMKQKKKLSDFFTDNKFSLFDKENTWLLTCDDEIVWVVNHRIDDRFKIGSSTKCIVEFRCSIN